MSEEFHEGDLVEAVKGEHATRARVAVLPSTGELCLPRDPESSPDRWTFLAWLESPENGYTLTVIEKAAPRPWLNAEVGETWHMEPFGCNYNVVRSVDRYFTRANVFGGVESINLDDDRITDAVKLEPAADTHARILPQIEEAARCIARSQFPGTSDVTTKNVLKGRRILAELIAELGASE